METTQGTRMQRGVTRKVHLDGSWSFPTVPLGRDEVRITSVQQQNNTEVQGERKGDESGSFEHFCSLSGESER